MFIPFLCTQVMGVTFDGASVNQKFISIHKSTTSEFLHKVISKYAADNRDLLFFSDPSHLIKMTQNCLISTTRHMQASVIILRFLSVPCTIRRIGSLEYFDNSHIFFLNFIVQW